MKKTKRKEIQSNVTNSLQTVIAGLDIQEPSKKTTKLIKKVSKKVSAELNQELKKQMKKFAKATAKAASKAINGKPSRQVMSA